MEIGLDLTLHFKPLRIAVLVVSDTRTLENDKSGDVLEAMLLEAGHELVGREIVTDDLAQIAEALEIWLAVEAHAAKADVILLSGGTGVTGRDQTPEAIEQVAAKYAHRKFIPGFGEMFRHLSFQHVGFAALQSRAGAWAIHHSYVFALPGSTGGCKDAWNEILVHQLDNRYRPCNFAELLPRLAEEKAS